MIGNGDITLLTE